jgi:hypothetical protein
MWLAGGGGGAALQRPHLFDRRHLVPSEPVHLGVSEFAVLDRAVEAPVAQRSTTSQTVRDLGCSSIIVVLGALTWECDPSSNSASELAG